MTNENFRPTTSPAPQLGFRFISTGTWTNASTAEAKAALLEPENGNIGDIVFIEATNQIYVAGAYFGLTDAQSTQLAEAYKQVTDTNDATTIKSKVGALETKVGDQGQIQSALFTIVEDLKAKLDGGSYAENPVTGSTINSGIQGANNATVTNAIDAINVLYQKILDVTANAGVTGVQGTQGLTVSGTGSGDVKSGLIILSTDAAQIYTTGAQGTQDAGIQSQTVESVLVGHQTTLAGMSGHQSAIEGHQTAIEGVQGDLSDGIQGVQTQIEGVQGDLSDGIQGVQTQIEGVQNNAIAKSSGTQQVLAGDQDVALVPSGIQTADNIIAAIKTAYDTLVGTEQHSGWNENEKKTLGTLADRIKTIETALNTGSVAEALTTLAQLEAELNNPDSAGTITSFLDTVSTIIGGAGTQGYQVNNGTQSNIQGVITALETEISGVQSAAQGVQTQLTNGIQGVQTQLTNGIQGVQTELSDGIQGVQSQISTLDSANVKSVNSQTPNNGAVTINGSHVEVTGYDKSGQTGNVATTDTVNNAIAKVENKADAAATAAGNAQTSVNTALGQLTWTIV